MPRAGSAGVDGTLAMRPSSKTTSVNAPPVSTPALTGSSWLDDPDLFLAEVIAQGADETADEGVVAIPHRHRLVAVASQPRVSPGQRRARLLLGVRLRRLHQ